MEHNWQRTNRGTKNLIFECTGCDRRLTIRGATFLTNDAVIQKQIENWNRTHKCSGVKQPEITPIQKMERKLMFKKLCETLRNLWSRWQDEAEYENFEDYKKIMKEAVEEAGAEFVSMTQKGFACELVFKGQRFLIRCSASQITMKAI